MRRGRSSLGSFMLIIIMVGAIAGYFYFPKWWDFMEMKEIARLAAAEWHVNENKAKARQKLTYTMENREIPLYIPDDACSFSERDKQRTIECAWTAVIEIPLIDKTFEEHFQFTTEVNATGKVRQW